MADTAPAVSTETAAPVAATPEPVKAAEPAAPPPEPGTEAHFQAALAAAQKEADAIEATPVVDKAEEHVPVEVKLEEKAEALEKEPAPPELTAKDKGTLGKARRLFAEGKVEEAIELALGVNLEKIEPTTKAWKEIKRKAIAAREEAAKARAEADSHVSQAKQAIAQVMPFVEGAQAYLAGDFQKFLQLTTGDTPEQFQRKLIAQLHEKPAVATDPAIVREIEQLKKERAEERAALKAAQEKLQAEQNQLRYQQAQQEWIEGIKTELKDNPQFAKVASKPAFVQRIFAAQQQAYNPKTQQTIDTIEAAEIVWEELYGDVVETNPPAGGKAGSTRAPSVNGENRERTAPSTAGTTTLRHQQATEAAPDLNGPWTPELQDKILERYIRMAQSARTS